MSEEFKVTLPKLGESIQHATVVQWFKKPGDYVEKDEPLLEVSTDKVNSEIPSPVAGVLKKIYAEVDQERQVGDVLASVEVKAKQGENKQSTSHSTAPTSSKEPLVQEEGFLSPAVLRLAHEKGVSLSEVEKMKGTGAGGRVTKKDIEHYIETRGKKGCPYDTTSISSGSEVEHVKMSGMRKAIADNMVRSFYEAPHASLVHEVDVTDVMQLIQQEKERFAQKHGVKLTVTSFVIHALAKAIQEYPLINSSLEKDTIVLKKYVNLGIAVSVEQGILVPVIKHCQKMSFSEIAKQLHDLSQRARSGKLQPEEVKEGTITLTNFGMSGVLIGIPIIRYPEVAIIGMGGIQKRVIVQEENTLAIRSMMNISFTFDHRVLDGMYGCGFLAALKKHLEQSPKEFKI